MSCLYTYVQKNIFYVCKNVLFCLLDVVCLHFVSILDYQEHLYRVHIIIADSFKLVLG